MIKVIWETKVEMNTRQLRRQPSTVLGQHIFPIHIAFDARRAVVYSIFDFKFSTKNNIIITVSLAKYGYKIYINFSVAFAV